MKMSASINSRLFVFASVLTLLHVSASPAANKALLAVDVAANPGFWNPAAAYSNAVANAGFAVAGIAQANAAGVISWPSPCTSNQFDAILYLTSENFFSRTPSVVAANEVVLSNYLESGGTLLIVGQDILWGQHQDFSNGVPAGSLYNQFIGITGVYQDVLTLSAADGQGAMGSILDGVAFTAHGRTNNGGVFYNNDLYPDLLLPGPGAFGLLTISNVNPCAVFCDRGKCKTAFSTLELASGGTTALQTMVTAILTWFRPPIEPALWDNGPLVSGWGTALDGNNISLLQTPIGMSTYGFGVSAGASIRLADDFTIPVNATWRITNIAFFIYQTGSTTTSTVLGVNLQIWDAPPSNPAAFKIFGDPGANYMVTSMFAGTYRAIAGSALNIQRPVMRCETAVNLVLGSGTYWLDWQATGAVALSGPWVPPVTIPGQTNTGNALQSIAGAWAPAQGGLPGSYQGLPFVIKGEESGVAAATNQPVGPVSWDFAYMNGTVNPHGSLTWYAFEYGPTTGYGSSSPWLQIGAVFANMTINGLAKWLTPGHTYHCRLVASNAYGLVTSADRVFATTYSPLSDTLAWSQPPAVLFMNGWLSQQGTSVMSKVADDFMFPTNVEQIADVRWWAIEAYPMSPYVTPDAWNIIIWSNDPAVNLPTNECARYSVPGALCNERVFYSGTFDLNEYWTPLVPPFQPASGEMYWITFQAVLTNPPQMYWSIAHEPIAGHTGAFQLTPSNAWQSLGYDFAYELYLVPEAAGLTLLAGAIALALRGRARRSG